MIWYLFSHRRHGVAAQEWMIKMQTITKLRVYDQRLDETGVKVLSGFEEYRTLRQGSVAETVEESRFREMDDAPLLL